MKDFLPEEALRHLRRFQFSKSWLNNFVSKKKKIVNTETRQLEETELDEFIYIPATSIVRHFSNDKQFLSFRSEYKNSKDWNYKLIEDAFENNNRRLAIMYLAKMLNVLDIEFVIDDGYTLYILHEELERQQQSEVPGVKEFMNSLLIPRTFVRKKGTMETWSH